MPILWKGTPVSPPEMAHHLFLFIASIITEDGDELPEFLESDVLASLEVTKEQMMLILLETPYLIWYCVYTVVLRKFPGHLDKISNALENELVERFDNKIELEVFRLYEYFIADKEPPIPDDDPLTSDSLLSAAGYACYRVFGETKDKHEHLKHMSTMATRINMLLGRTEDFMQQYSVEFD
jgi:hypothetical protein